MFKVLLRLEITERTHKYTSVSQLYRLKNTIIMSFTVKAYERPFPLYVRRCLTSLDDRLATMVTMETAAHKGLLFYGYVVLYQQCERSTAIGRDILLDGV